jgi:signal transduction histidine kinase
MRAAPLQQLEQELRRDIAEAFFNARSALEVYRLALTRVTPLVNASFSSVFLRDAAEPELLRLVCAHNWPQSSARFLSQMRIRVGRGPTGEAVADRQAIEVCDVYADAALRDWWDPARELGFAALISLPLVAAGQAAGAVSFYYAQPHTFNDGERGLLRVIAQQLSITAERAGKLDRLRQVNDLLRSEIEELRSREDEATEAQRLKTEFLANMSHELRTPLTSIMGYTYLLLEGQAGALTPAQAINLQKIDVAANALLRLINDLLELTTIKLGRAALLVIPTDAVLIARRAAQDVEVAPPVHFRFERPSERISLQTDPDKVLKILENLLSNAVKFTPAGEIVLEVERVTVNNEARIEWRVRDTGIGIPPEKQSAIFDEFQQVDGSSTRLYGGTGLGLALSLQLARLLGGELLVSSTDGAGSMFTLRLPLQPPKRLRIE